MARQVTMWELWPSSWTLPALESQSYKDRVVSKHKLCDNKLLHTFCLAKTPRDLWQTAIQSSWRILLWDFHELCDNILTQTSCEVSKRFATIDTKLLEVPRASCQPKQQLNCCKSDGWYSHVNSFETNGIWIRGFSRVSGYRFVSNELKVTYH